MRVLCTFLSLIATASAARAQSACPDEVAALRAQADEIMGDIDLRADVRASHARSGVRAEVVVTLPGGASSARQFHARSCRIAARAARIYLQLIARSRPRSMRALAVPIAPAAAVEAARVEAPLAAQAPESGSGRTRAPAPARLPLTWDPELAAGLILAAGPTPKAALAAALELGLGIGDRYRGRLSTMRSSEQRVHRGDALATFRATSVGAGLEARALGPAFATAALEWTSIVGRSESSAMPMRRRGRAITAAAGMAARLEIGRVTLLARAELALPLAGDRFLVVTPRGEQTVHSADRAGFRGALLFGWSLFDPDPSQRGHLEGR